MLKKRLKPVYLLFLIIPLFYSFLWKNQSKTISDKAKQPDYLSFSVKSTTPASLSLIENQHELISWNINSKAYKNLEFAGSVNSNVGFKLKVNNLNINDTLFFLGINFYSNSKLFSTDYAIRQHIVVTNARITKKNGALILVAEKSKIPINISLKPPTLWEIYKPFNIKKAIIIIVFILVFLLTVLFNPSTKYFILSLILAVFVLAASFFTYDYSKGNVKISTSSKIKNAEIFYSKTPFFSATKKYSSENITDVFSQPINLETEKYLRFDIGDSLISLTQIKIKISSGIFSKTYNLTELPQDRLVLNDLVLVGSTYYVCGNDPYIKFASTYFVDKLDFLLFLERNIFLFITLVVFLFFISLHGILDKKLHKLKLKPAYLTLLLIPIVYYQIDKNWIIKTVPQKFDYLYFSAKTSHPSVFTLLNGRDSLASWIVDSQGYKYLQYKGHFNINENFFLKITNLSKHDTVSFLSINLFYDNKTYSLFEKNNSVCKINNAYYIDKSNDFNALVKKTGMPVFISLLPSNILKKDNQENRNNYAIVLIVFFTFIFVLKFSPDQRFFIVSGIVTSLMMVIFFWLSNDAQSQFNLSTSSPSNRVDFFFNNNPGFVPSKTYMDLTSKNEFKFQMHPYLVKFYRCDIGEKNEKLKDLVIRTKTGILRNYWDYRTISSEKILLNDIIKRGGEYQICGDDPFIALSSAYQVNKIQSIFLIRQNLFFYISILLFLILIASNKYYKQVKLPNFFLLVFFVIFIFIGLILHIFNSENIILVSEKRCTNPLPAFQTDSSVVYTNDLNNYILDQLPGRKNIIKMNNLVQYCIFKQLVNNQVIYFGDDGWMYYIAGPAKADYENRHPLTVQELEKLKNVLVERNEWLKKRGIHFYMIFPPMPQTVYEENVGPRFRRYYKQTKAEQLLEYLKLNTDLDVIDIHTPLVKAKSGGFIKPYYKSNCHWNNYGGYIAYCSMINYIRKDFPNIGKPLNSNDFKWVESSDFKPDLLQLMDIDKFFTFKEYKPVFKDNIITDTVYPFYLDLWTPAPPACVRTKRTSYPTMLMYGDSYAGGVLRFLFCNFSKTYFLWTPLFHPEIIEKEKPDMVIQEMIDVSIINLLLKNKPLPEMKDSINKP